MDYRENVHKKLQNLRKQEQEEFCKAKDRSADFVEALQLSSEDLKVLKRSTGPDPPQPLLFSLGDKGFLKLNVVGEVFALIVREVLVSAYVEHEQEFQHMILAVSLRTPGLNHSLGAGPSLINVIPEEWHKIMMDELTGNKFRDDMRPALPAALPEKFPKELQELW